MIKKIKDIIFQTRQKFRSKEFVDYKLTNLHINAETIEEGGEVFQKLPNIVNIGFTSKGYNIMLPERLVFEYENVYIFPGYSFIFKEDLVEIPKLRHIINKLKAKVVESKIKLDNNNLRLYKTKRKEIYSNVAISLVGHYSLHYGHFVLEYLERLEYLKKMDIQNIDVIVHKQSDANTLELIKQWNEKINFRILLVKYNSIVYCKKYYHIEPHSLICDGAYYSSITDKLFYKKFNNFYKEFYSAPLLGKGSRLYVGRKGLRTITNSAEIERYFISNGYKVVYDFHELSLDEKKDLFGNASYVVGPAGSAFFNCLWCPRDVKILTFINYEIAYDNVLQNMLSEESEIYHIAGKEVNYEFYNSDFHIDLQEIMYYSTQLGFTS